MRLKALRTRLKTLSERIGVYERRHLVPPRRLVEAAEKALARLLAATPREVLSKRKAAGELQKLKKEMNNPMPRRGVYRAPTFRRQKGLLR